MVRQGDQKGACLLSNLIRLGNRGIPAPNHQRVRRLIDFLVQEILPGGGSVEP
jgi:hypothetical protein